MFVLSATGLACACFLSGDAIFFLDAAAFALAPLLEDFAADLVFAVLFAILADGAFTKGFADTDFAAAGTAAAGLAPEGLAATAESPAG